MSRNCRKRITRKIALQQDSTCHCDHSSRHGSYRGIEEGGEAGRSNIRNSTRGLLRDGESCIELSFCTAILVIFAAMTATLAHFHYLQVRPVHLIADDEVKAFETFLD